MQLHYSTHASSSNPSVDFPPCSHVSELEVPGNVLSACSELAASAVRNLLSCLLACCRRCGSTPFYTFPLPAAVATRHCRVVYTLYCEKYYIATDAILGTLGAVRLLTFSLLTGDPGTTGQWASPRQSPVEKPLEQGRNQLRPVMVT